MIASGLLDVIDLSILLNSLATVYIDAILILYVLYDINDDRVLLDYGFWNKFTNRLLFSLPIV